LKTAANRTEIVADRYFEWQKPDEPKQPCQPFCHRLPGGELFAFADLWATPTTKDAEERRHGLKA
jgi:putative SOS response-associated peptidase YedK